MANTEAAYEASQAMEMAGQTAILDLESILDDAYIEVNR